MRTASEHGLRNTPHSRKEAHTTIAIQKKTKEKLDNSRAPGQCYNGFICELIDCWERYKIGTSLCGPGEPVKDTRR